MFPVNVPNVLTVLRILTATGLERLFQVYLNEHLQGCKYSLCPIIKANALEKLKAEVYISMIKTQTGGQRRIMQLP